MAIEDPRINVALSTNSGRTSILIRRSDADDGLPGEPMRWVSWQLGAIEHAGYMAACERIGNAVMRLLHQAHPARFVDHPMLAPPDELTALDRLTDLVNDLIRRSASERTCAYVPAIDAILVKHAAELGQTNLPAQWPTFREVFMGYHTAP